MYHFIMSVRRVVLHCPGHYKQIHVILLNLLNYLGDATSLDASIKESHVDFLFLLHQSSLSLLLLHTAMSNDIAEPRRTGRERKQVEKFEPKRKLP